uniref:Uncharacterized protein n=1 Tax=Romanomermis culicivorax TaxID=13658 RepID=A0A915HN96_ROMCU
MAIEANGARNAGMVAVVCGIVAAGRRSLQETQPIVQASHFIQKESQMGGVHGIDYAKLFSPEAGNPSQNERGIVRR